MSYTDYLAEEFAYRKAPVDFTAAQRQELYAFNKQQKKRAR